jgi:peptidoglycan/LPS O-acetylase OafA/YrhL
MARATEPASSAVAAAPPRVEFANALSGLAALFVLMSHHLGQFWLDRSLAVGYADVPRLEDSVPTPLLVSILNPTRYFDWGAFGVALFFLISGFVIPFAFERYGWKGFLAGRFFRIYPTYAVGFTATLLAIYLGGLYFDRPFPHGLSDMALHYLVGFRALLGGPNIDGIVWTLDVEVRFYILCALAAVWLRRGSLLVLLLPAALAVAILAAPSLGRPLPVSTQFLLFMFIGVAFNLHYRGRLERAPLIFVIATLFSLFAGAWHLGRLHGISIQLWSYGAALACFALAYAGPQGWARNRLLRFLADISYPLYVVHAIAGFVLLRILLDRGTPAAAAIAAVLLGALALAWLIHRFVEAPTHRLGRRLAYRLSRNVGKAGAAVVEA